jgi:hypothetical protein
MKLLAAYVKGTPREVSTKYGQRSVMDVVLMSNNEAATIWGNAGCKDILNRANGEKVQVGLDSKNKYHLVTHAGSNLSESPEPITSTDYNAHNGRSAEIADYVQRLSKLYHHTYRTVKEQMVEENLTSEDIRAITTGLMIQTVKHFLL